MIMKGRGIFRMFPDNDQSATLEQKERIIISKKRQQTLQTVVTVFDSYKR